MSKGISQETISRVIAHDWFRKKPTEELWEIWAEFSAATSASLNPSMYNELIDKILRLCRLVADASGGFMGLGKISTTETQAIDRVTRTLQQTDADRTHAESSSVAAQALTPIAMVLSAHALRRSRHDHNRQKCEKDRGSHADVPGSDLAAGGAD